MPSQRRCPDDDTLGNDLEAAADAANEAAPQIPWEQLGAIAHEARAAAQLGALTSDDIEALLARAADLVPASRPDILDELRVDLRSLL